MWVTYLTGYQSVKRRGKSMNNSNRLLLIILVFIYVGIIVSLLTICLPVILDIIAPLAESRERKLPFVFECFFDQQKYYYVIVLYLIVVTMLGEITFMTSETLYMVLVQHACGLFAITR